MMIQSMYSTSQNERKGVDTAGMTMNPRKYHQCRELLAIFI